MPKKIVTSRREQLPFISREGKECDRLKLRWKFAGPCVSSVQISIKLWGSFCLNGPAITRGRFHSRLLSLNLELTSSFSAPQLHVATTTPIRLTTPLSHSARLILLLPHESVSCDHARRTGIRLLAYVRLTCLLSSNS